MPVLLRLPTLEASRGVGTPPGFARVQLFLDRVLPEDRHWWRDAMSERADGALYLSRCEDLLAFHCLLACLCTQTACIVLLSEPDGDILINFGATGAR